MAAAVLVAALVAGIAVVLTHRSSQVPTGLAAGAVVTTSSTAAKSSANALLDSGSSRRPGKEWVAAGTGVGSWMQLTWPHPVELNQLVLVTSSKDTQRVSAGFFTFSDNSSLQATLDPAERATTVAFASRTITSVRFSVSTMAPESSLAAMAELIPAMTSGAGSVLVDRSTDGNSATSAAVSSSAGADVTGLNDGRSATGSQQLYTSWSVNPVTDSWAQLSWSRPRELASVQLYGATDTPQHISSGRLEFGDGSAVLVGEVLPGGAHPTTVAFMPRVTKTLRFVVLTTTGPGSVGLAEMRAYATRATPARPTSAATPTHPATTTCPPPPASPTKSAITVTCPLMGAGVDATTTIDFLAPGVSEAAVSIWPSDPASIHHTAPEVKVSVDGQGRGSAQVDLTGLGRGPVTIRLRPVTPATGGAETFFQLYHRGAAASSESAPASPAQAADRTLVYDDEFSSPLSLSRDGLGADYAAAKPLYWGAEDFGDAIFPDPKLGVDNVSVVDKRYLRIGVEPNPPGYADPGQFHRTHIGGMVASARRGGSGFSAQYGYFEARMMAPAGAGTWPAFWQLSNTNLISKIPEGAEIDTVELYGHDPVSACHATHQYLDGKGTGGEVKCTKQFDDTRTALTWHVYGADVTPTEVTYYIDGRQVARIPQVVGGDQPMFFMLNLQLGGGWPVKLDTVGNRACLYVDYVRVYV